MFGDVSCARFLCPPSLAPLPLNRGVAKYVISQPEAYFGFQRAALKGCWQNSESAFFLCPSQFSRNNVLSLSKDYGKLMIWCSILVRYLKIYRDVYG